MTTPMVSNSSLLISSARKAAKFLHGTINLYKPAGMRTSTVIESLKTNICRDLNDMEIETPESIVQIESSDNKNFEINVIPNIAQHILSVGPSYTTDSFKFKAANVLSANMSGVLVLGVNRGTKFANMLRSGATIQTFQVTGKFGSATETNFGGSRVITKATYGHVTAGKLQALVSTMQATHQRQMFAMSGLDIKSQAAYELACKGLIRPKDTKSPVIYGIRPIGPVGKTFTIEVQTMNATEEYLTSLVLDIATHLRTVAHCMKIRCTRFGFFTYENSLLRSHWNLQNTLESMHDCKKIWDEHPEMVRDELSTPVGH